MALAAGQETGGRALLRGVGTAALTLALLPALCLVIAFAVVNPRFRRGLWGRFVGPRPARPARPGAIWVHVASVGEAAAARRLISTLHAERGPVQLTCQTWNGLDALRRDHPTVPSALAPLDHPWCLHFALARMRPRALVLVETEIWPCTIAALSRRSVPIIVVSGRLGAERGPMDRAARFVLRRSFGRLTAVAARSDVDARRFVAAGASADRVSVAGDLKHGKATSVAEVDTVLEAALCDVPSLLAGSTHEPEELELLAALDVCEEAGTTMRLVIAPRHPERAALLADSFRGAGRAATLRSELDSERPLRDEILVIDSLGELPALWSVACLGFVGGSFIERGAHDVLEPVRAGCPVSFGPHLAAGSADATRLLEMGAAREVADGRALGRAFVALNAEPGLRSSMIDAGRVVLAETPDTLAANLAVLTKWIEAPATGADTRGASA